MKPSRELDILVATKVMGMPEDPDLWVWAPRYSLSLEAAWEVVEKMKDKGFASAMVNGIAANHVIFQFYNALGKEIKKQAESAPHAICLAALKAMGVDV